MSAELKDLMKFLKSKMKKGNYGSVQITIQDGKVIQVTEHKTFNTSAFSSFCDSLPNPVTRLTVKNNNDSVVEGVEEKTTDEDKKTTDVENDVKNDIKYSENDMDLQSKSTGIDNAENSV